MVRADKHIADLEAAVSSWLEAGPFAHFSEINESGTHESHTLSFFIPVPDAIADCAFDAASNLRACLDSAVYAIASGHNPSGAEKVHFPIADTKSSFDNIFTKRYQAAFPEKVVHILRQFQPYERGNGHLIWTLNRVRRQAEHRLLVRCKAKASFRLISSSICPGSEFQFFEYVESNEDDIVFAISPVGSEFEFEMDVTINVAFGDGVEAAAGQPVVRLLKDIREQVSNAVASLENEARRIGIV